VTTTVTDQAGLDAAIDAGAEEVILDGDGHFVVFTPADRCVLVARGSSQPRVVAWGSSQPRVEADADTVQAPVANTCLQCIADGGTCCSLRFYDRWRSTEEGAR
jgi:hypothetical protein